MLRAILVGMVWLVGMAPAGWAFDLRQPELLRYSVHWGFLNAGKAELEYRPEGSAYVIESRVRDGSMLLDMDSRWTARGTHMQGRVFVPQSYTALQKENDYRADKVVTFDAQKGRVTYVNRIDASDTVAPLAWTTQGMRDALSAIYAWRAGGVGELQKAGRVEVMGVKRPFVLVKGAAKKERVRVGGKDTEVWSVEIGSEVDGKVHRDTWTVRLRDDGRLTPVQVIARNKFGTFRAILEE